MGKYLITIISLLTLSVNVLAQKTLEDALPGQTFRKGVELFDDKQYAAAQSVFRQYLEQSMQSTTPSGYNYNQKAEAEYYIAVSAIELNQNDAELILDKFIHKYPEHPRAKMISFYLGRYQYRQHLYEKAIASFQKTDAYDLTDKDREEFYFMNGYSYYKLKKNPEAKDYFGKIKGNESDNGRLAAYYYGLISYQNGRYDEALKEFNLIKEDKKFKALLPQYISQIYLLQGNYDKVIESGEESLKDNSTEAGGDIRLYVAQAYYAKKNYAKAAEYYQQYNQPLPESLEYQYGYSLYHEKQYEDAIKAFSALTIKEDSIGQNAAWHLGSSYLNTGNKEKARSTFEFAARLNYDKNIKELATLNYAKLCYELNFQKEAIDAFRAFLKNYPHSEKAGEVKELLSRILLASNNPKEALEVLESIPDRSEKLEDAYQKILYLYAMEKFNNRNYTEAEKYYVKSLEHERDRKIKALALFWLGETQYKLGRLDEAQANYKKFLYVSEAQETPYYNVVNYNLGYTYFKKEDYQYSNIYFKKYLANEKSAEMSPRHIDAILRSADCEFVSKNYAEAKQNYEKVIEAQAPEADYAMYQKGTLQGLQGKSNDKIATMKSLAKKYPGSAYLDDALFSIAEVYENHGNDAEAISSYEFLNQNYPKNPYYRAAILNIGMIYYNRQEDNKAVPIFKGIITKYPYSEEAKQALKAIKNSYIDRGMTDSLANFYKDLPNGNLSPSSEDSDLYSAAFSNVKNSDCPATIKSMESYLKKFPNGYSATDANYYAATCAYENGDSVTAQTHFNAIINRSPNSYMEQALKASGDLYFNAHNNNMAEKRYEQLEEIAANKDNVLHAINGAMHASYNDKNYDKTIEAANKLLNLGYADAPVKTEAQFYIGRSDLIQNKLDQAMASMSVVYKENKAEMGAEAMYDVCYILFTQEKYTESEDLIYKMKDDFASYDYWRAKAFIILADINVKKADYFTAKNILQSIIDNSDDGEVKTAAQEKLAKVTELEKNNVTPAKENENEEQK